ncbi:hypothetical protein ES703_34077 [subsurface metagenome]
MTEKTSIQVSVETKERLVRLGIKGETYGSIIQRLLDKNTKTKRKYNNEEEGR